MPIMFDAAGNPYMGPDLTPQESKALQATNSGETLRSKAPGKDVVVRNMKQVGPAMKEVFGERIPNAQLSGPTAQAAGEAAATGGRGLLSRLGGAAFGPVGTGIQAALMPGELGAGDRPMTEEEAARGRPDAQAYAQRVQANAKAAANPKTGLGLLSSGVTVPSGEAQAATPEKASAIPEPIKQEIAKRQEGARQGVERNIGDKLKDSSLSRPKLAEEVVKADCQQRGIDPTPNEKKKMVADEVQSMRTMDNNQLAKYASFAIMGLGFLAGGTSEEAGQAFASNFNNGYQRVIAQAAAERKFAYEAQQDAIQNAREETKIKNTSRDIDSKIKDRETGQALNQKKFVLDEADTNSRIEDRLVNQDLGRGRLAVDQAGLGLRERSLAIDEAKLPLEMENLKARTAASKASAAKAAQITKKGAEVSTKDAQEFLESSLEASGYNLDNNSKVVLTQQYRQYQAANPGTDPNVILKAILEQAKTSSNSRGFGPIKLNPSYELDDNYLFNEE